MFSLLLLDSVLDDESFAEEGGSADPEGEEDDGLEPEGGLAADEAARMPSEWQTVGRGDRVAFPGSALIGRNRSVRKPLLGRATRICLANAICAVALNEDSMGIE